jgi:coenzyme PQQ precursor peptide PqqA
LTLLAAGCTIVLECTASGGTHMREWHKPEVTEQEVGLEVTSYLPAEV